MEKIRVLLADDHPMIIEGVRRRLSESTEIEVIAEANTGKEALASIIDDSPDVIIMDINMPEMDGIQVMKSALLKKPDLKIIFFSTYPEEHYAIRLLRLGASGFLSKTVPAAVLIESIIRVYNGGKYFSEKVNEMIYSQLSKPAKVTGETEGVDDDNHSSLSAREFEILRMIGDRQSPSEIAQKLSISPKTVSTHISNMSRKLGVKQKAGLLHYAITNNITGDQMLNGN
ncbi:response regulator [Methylobacillus sp. Pita2]|uniref:response regulator transcription factor n=1 Tax=Methylobacillus sp. Pita2 TaxID=3383245 RepID=UPI0038B474D9